MPRLAAHKDIRYAKKMKSTAEQLKNRGYVSDNDLVLYKNLPERDLVELLQSKDADKRTVAIKLLAQSNNEQFIPLFCEALKTEKKLYTKMELCAALENYGEKAIPYLMPLLGTIGNNRHNKIDIIDLQKKSYPLPRDIVARILIRIGPSVFPELKKILLENKNKIQIPNAIDVVGHVTWNYNDYSLENVLKKCWKKIAGMNLSNGKQ
jgi:ribosomal protein S8